MNLKRILAILTITIALLLITTQAFASSSASPETKSTPGPQNTPGAKATQKADERATKQADKPPHGKREHYKGTIAAVDASTLTLTLGDGSSVTIGLTGDTRFKVPTLKGASAISLHAGMTAMVQAVRDQNDALVARFVVVIPGKPAKTHHVGWVTSYTPSANITIQAHDGNLYTFALTGDTKLLPAERAAELAVGSRVTIIAPRNPSALVSIAYGIVVHPAGSGAGSQPAAAPTP